MSQGPNKKARLQHIPPWIRKKLSEVNWQRFVVERADAEDWIAGAIDRLENGYVSSTRHGIRVQVREELGEYGWEGAAAFWPKEKHGVWFCSCTDHAVFGMCSHALAARVYREWLKERARCDAAEPSREMWWLPSLDDDTSGSGESVDEDDVPR